jgi:CRISPR-associated protein Cmr1
METLEATYKVVTPLFCSGADQRQAELRLPSIKGALRFWWRALAWERLGNLEKVRQEEAQLFGSTDREVGQAKVLMRLSNDALRTETADVRDQEWQVNTWRHYTGYGLVVKRTRTNPHAREQRAYIAPRQSFQLSVSAREARLLAQLMDALKVFGLLGGLGARARNGWGSVTLASLTVNGQTHWQAPSDKAALEHELRRYVHGKRAAADYTAFSQQTRFAVGRAYPNAQQAQQALSRFYKEFVSELRGSDKNAREAFGLPRNLQLPSGRYEKANIRRAGAVFLHLHEFANGSACPVVAVLPADFLAGQREPEGGWQAAYAFVDAVRQELT